MNATQLAQELGISPPTLNRLLDNMGWGHKKNQDTFSEEDIAEIRNADQIRQRLGQKGVKATYQGESTELSVSPARKSSSSHRATAASPPSTPDDIEHNPYFDTVYEQERAFRLKVIDHAMNVLAHDGSLIDDINSLRGKYAKKAAEQLRSYVKGFMPPPLEFDQDNGQQDDPAPATMPEPMNATPHHDNTTIDIDATEEEEE